MSIIYKCKHCGQTVGTLKKQNVNQEQLGIDELSDKEKSEMVHEENGGSTYIHAICESCEHTLKEYPQYYELDFFIH